MTRFNDVDQVNVLPRFLCCNGAVRKFLFPEEIMGRQKLDMWENRWLEYLENRYPELKNFNKKFTYYRDYFNYLRGVFYFEANYENFLKLCIGNISQQTQISLAPTDMDKFIELGANQWLQTSLNMDEHIASKCIEVFNQSYQKLDKPIAHIKKFLTDELIVLGMNCVLDWSVDFLNEQNEKICKIFIKPRIILAVNNEELCCLPDISIIYQLNENADYFFKKVTYDESMLAFAKTAETEDRLGARKALIHLILFQIVETTRTCIADQRFLLQGYSQNHGFHLADAFFYEHKQLIEKKLKSSSKISKRYYVDQLILLREFLPPSAEKTDFSSLDLSDIQSHKELKVQKINLSNANLSRARLQYSNLEEVDLSCAVLIDSHLFKSILRDVNLCGVNFSGSDWHEVKLSKRIYFDDKTNFKSAKDLHTVTMEEDLELIFVQKDLSDEIIFSIEIAPLYLWNEYEKIIQLVAKKDEIQKKDLLFETYRVGDRSHLALKMIQSAQSDSMIRDVLNQIYFNKAKEKSSDFKTLSKLIMHFGLVTEFGYIKQSFTDRVNSQDKETINLIKKEYADWLCEFIDVIDGETPTPADELTEIKIKMKKLFSMFLEVCNSEVLKIETGMLKFFGKNGNTVTRQKVIEKIQEKMKTAFESLEKLKGGMLPNEYEELRENFFYVSRTSTTRLDAVLQKLPFAGTK